MRRERLIILLGLLVALIFFYFGLNEWLKTREEKVQPLPVVVKPPAEPPKEVPQKEEKPPEEQKDKVMRKAPEKESKPEQPVQKKEEPPKEPEKKEKKDVIAQKTKEESVVKKVEKPRAKKKAETRLYTVQVGAFKDKERAEKTMEKAKKMGYEAQIVEEDDFYKVRLTLRTENINSELSKLRKTFGGAIIKQ